MLFSYSPRIFPLCLKIISCFYLLFINSSALAVNKSFNNPSGGDWNVGANWSPLPSSVPTINDAAFINIDNPSDVTMSTPGQAQSVTITRGGLSISGSTTLLNVGGNMNVIATSTGGTSAFTSRLNILGGAILLAQDAVLGGSSIIIGTEASSVTVSGIDSILGVNDFSINTGFGETNQLIVGTNGKLVCTGALTLQNDGGLAQIQASSGGIIETNTITADGNASSMILFNNATLKPHTSAGLTISGFNPQALMLRTGGVTIDTAVGNVTVNSPFINMLSSAELGTLTKVSTGTLTLAADNTYTGVTTISGGTLQLGNGGTSGNVVSASIVDNAALIFNRSNTVNYGGVISGTGSLTKQGIGTLTLTGTNSYTGSTTISGGALQLGNSGSTGSVTSASIVDNGSLIFNRSDALTYGGVISGSGALTKQGAGTLTLTGTNTYSGGTTISGGALQLGNGGTTGSVASTSIVNNGALIFNRSNTTPVTYTGVISGTGSLATNGSGDVTLSGASTYTGGTTVSNGKLTLNNASLSIGSATSNVVLADTNSAIFNLNGGSNVTANNVTLSNLGHTGTLNITNSRLSANQIITGAGTASMNVNGGTLRVLSNQPTFLTNGVTIGAGGMTVDTNGFDAGISSVLSGGTVPLTKQGSGKLTLLANNLYLGLTSVSAGTLQLGNCGTTGSVAGDIFVNTGAQLVFNRLDTSIYAGVVSGGGSVTKACSGTLILTGDSTYTGGTTISTGTLQLGNAGTTGSVTGPIDITSGGTLVFNHSGTTIYGDNPGEVLTGSGNLVQGGPSGSTLILTSDNPFTGLTTVSTGTTLQLGNGGTTGTVLGNIQVNTGGNVTLNHSGDYTYGGVISGDGGLNQVSGTTTLTGQNTYTGGTTISGGTLQVGGGGNIPGNVTNNSDLVFDVPDNTTLVYDNVISGTGTVTKIGGGVFLLNSINLYTGNTYVNAGAFRLGDAAHTDASIPGDLEINSGGSLQGYGTVGGNVSNNGGIVSPANSIGTLTILGDYTQTPSGAYVVQVNQAGNADLLQVGGTASLSGTIAVSAENNGFLKQYPYTIITAGNGVVGQFNNTDFDGNFTQGFLSAQVLYFPNQVQFIVGYNSTAFTAAAQTPNQQAMANYLLTNQPTTVAIQKLIASLQTPEEFQRAMDQLSGVTYANQALMLAKTGSWFEGELMDQINGFRPCGISEGMRQSSDCEQRRGWWLAGHADSSRIYAGSVSGLDTNAGDMALGYALPLGNKSRLGLGVGYAHFESDATRREMADNTGNLLQLGVYGRYATGNFVLGVGLDAGKTDQVKAHRQINSGVDGVVTTTGSYQAKLFGEQVQASYDIVGEHAFRISPFIGVVNQQLNRDGFSESSDTGFELNLARASYRSTRSQLGAFLEIPIKQRIKPFLLAQWEHEFADQKGVFDANIVGMTGQFNAAGQLVGRDAALVKAGMVLLQGKNWTVSALYEGWFANEWQQNGGTLEARVYLG